MSRARSNATCTTQVLDYIVTRSGGDSIGGVTNLDNVVTSGGGDNIGSTTRLDNIIAA